MKCGYGEIDRRGFLRASGIAAAVAAVGAPVLLSPNGALAVQLSGALDRRTADTLLVMLRHLYPHASLGDVYYLNVVADLDTEAKNDEATQALLKDGVARLDRAMSVPFLRLSPGYQLKVLEGMESDPFFQKVRGKAVVSLYNQPLVWRQLGYEGPSWPHGGYIDRGFDDLAWLPEPPETASPPKHG